MWSQLRLYIDLSWLTRDLILTRLYLLETWHEPDFSDFETCMDFLINLMDWSQLTQFDIDLSWLNRDLDFTQLAWGLAWLDLAWTSLNWSATWFSSCFDCLGWYGPLEQQSLQTCDPSLNGDIQNHHLSSSHWSWLAAVFDLSLLLIKK